MQRDFATDGDGLLVAGARNDVASRSRASTSWAWWCFLVICLAGVPVYYFATKGMTQRFVYDGYGLSSASVMLIGLRLNRPQKRGPWLAFATGTALFALGDIVFNIYAIVGATVPVPSVADLLYLIAYPILGIGMLLLVHFGMPRAQLISGLDGLIVALAAGALAWTFILGPYARNDGLSVPTRLTEIAYPTLDLLLVAVIVRLLFSAGVRNFSFRLLFTSVALLLITDTLSTFATLHNWFSFVHATPIDIGWIASYALWGAAALHPSMSRLAVPTDSNESRHPRAALLLLGVAAMTTPMIIITRELQDERADVGILTTISAVIFALIVVRLWLVSKYLRTANERLADAVARQTVFTNAAEAFVGAADVDEVVQAGVAAAAALAHLDTSWSTFVVNSPLGPTVGAAAGHSPYRVGDLFEGVDESHRGVRSEGRVERAERNMSVHVAEPVTVDDEIRGFLHVSDGAGCSEALTASLRLICSEMGLAMKGVEAAEERLRQRNERRFGSLVQKSTDLVTLVDRDGRILYQSPCVLQMLGRRADRMVGHDLSELVHGDDVGAFRNQFAKVQSGAYQTTIELECRLAHEDGSWRTVDSFMTNLLDDPDVGAILLNSRDVTERRSLEQQLHHQAFHDSLTGLANRALFLDRLSQALLSTHRGAASIVVMFIDIDDFKVVNDSLGHEAGDKVLAAVGQRLALAVRPGDTLARLGGDEFAVVADFTGTPQAVDSLAVRILQAIREPIQIGDDSVLIQASIGVALGCTPDDGPEVLVRNADLAMYSAKRNGKDRFETFQQSMYSQAATRYDLVADLRQALANEELEVYYQTIVTAHDSRVLGVEALVRWNRQGFGMVPASEFIAVAESTQLIIPLGEWVLNQACTQAQSWRADGIVGDTFFVSVNLSTRQLAEPNIVERVSHALSASKLPASALVLEITESFLVLDFDTGLDRLTALKSLGLRLAIDDYGTGYSSLSRLADLPVDIVKIDKTFIDRLTLGQAGKSVVQSIVDVTSALGMLCIAEGVESEDQRVALADMGCDNAQGYLFAKPMPSLEAGLLLRMETPHAATSS